MSVWRNRTMAYTLAACACALAAPAAAQDRPIIAVFNMEACSQRIPRPSEAERAPALAPSLLRRPVAARAGPVSGISARHPTSTC
jgi:hypothetical protein